MAFDISYNFQATDNFTNVSRKISKSVDRLTAKMSKFQQKIKSAGKSMADLGKKMMLRVSAPIIGFGIAAVKASSDIEDLNIAFETMMHSATKAKNMVESLTDFAARTPFHLEDIGGAAKSLLNIGVNAKQVIPILKRLSDIAAITKMPLESLVNVYARIHQRGKMTVRELMPLVRAHTGIVTVLKKMAKEAGHAHVDVYAAIAKGAATAKVFDEAIKRLTTGMGIFAGGAEKMSHTISGLFSTIRDSIKFYFLRPIGDIIIDSLQLQKKMHLLIIWFGKAKKAIVNFGKTHKELAKLIVIVSLLVASLAPILVIVGTMVFLFGILINPVTLVVAGIVSLVGGMAVLYATSKKFRDMIRDIGYFFKLYEPALIIIKDLVFGVVKLMILFQKVTGGLILNNFKRMQHIVNAIVHGIMSVVHYIGKISSLFSHHKGTIELQKSVMLKQAQPFARQQTFTPLAMPQQRVRSDVNIALHDPGNFVNRMYGKSDGGDLGFNLGANMLTSY
jgi:hypothetical protein